MRKNIFESISVVPVVFWLLRVVSCAVVRTETRLVKAEEDARAVGELTSGRTFGVVFITCVVCFQLHRVWVSFTMSLGFVYYGFGPSKGVGDEY